MSCNVSLNICRVCMSVEKAESLIENGSLRTKFEYITKLAVDQLDNMPQMICSTCITHLKCSYDFVRLANKTERNLKAFLSKVNNDFQQFRDAGVVENESMADITANDLPIEGVVIKLERQKRPELLLLKHEIMSIDNSDEFSMNAPSEQEYLVDNFEVLIGSTNNSVDFVHSADNVDNENNNEQPATESDTETGANNANEPGNACNSNLVVDEDYYEENETDKENRECDEDSTDDYDKKDHDEEKDIVEKVKPLEQNTNDQDSLCVYLQEYEPLLEELCDDINDINGAGSLVAPNAYENKAAYLQQLDDGNSSDDSDQNDRQAGSSETCGSEVLKFQSDGYVQDKCTLQAQAKKKSTSNKITMKTKKTINKIKNSNNKNIKPNKTNYKSTKKLIDLSEIKIERYYCMECNRDFSTKTNLTRHMITHTGVRPYKCTYCSREFSQNGSLKQHMYIHTGEKPHSCEVCSRSFTQGKSLVFHMRRHTGEKPFHCLTCDIAFRQKDGLKLHLLKHHSVISNKDGVYTYKCIICPTFVKNKHALQDHMLTHVNNHIDSTAVVATSADSTTSNNSNILPMLEDEGNILPIDESLLQNETILHINNVNAAAHIVDAKTSSAALPSRTKKYQCRKCFKCFSIKKNLERHLSVHNMSMEKLVKCHKCQISFKTKFDLLVHQMRQHKQDINLKICISCKTVFGTIDELHNHLMDEHFFNIDCKLREQQQLVEELIADVLRGDDQSYTPE